MKLLVIIIALIAAVGASAQTRDYRSMTPEELAAFEAANGIEHGSRWRFRKPKQSPFTVSLGPNIIMSHIPVKFAKGVNHDFGFDASITYRNLYLDYNHSFTKSYFTFQGIAAGYAFTFANEENGMVISPNFGIGAAKVDIPTLAGYYRHTYTMLGLGADFRFYMGLCRHGLQLPLQRRERGLQRQHPHHQLRLRHPHLERPKEETPAGATNHHPPTLHPILIKYKDWANSRPVFCTWVRAMLERAEQ